MLQKSWYVLRTKQHRERLAEFHLKQSGVETYLPLIRQWPRPIVGSDIVPLFCRYIFVRLALPDDYRMAARASGVKCFVSLESGRPSEIHCEAIDFLRAREGPDGLVRCDSPTSRGTRARIGKGAMRDFCGVVEQRLRAGERVILLMQLLQREVRVEVPERWLRAI